MKPGDKLKVIEVEGLSQSYIEPGEVCEYIKTFENYYCVRYKDREMLLNKLFLSPAPPDIESEKLALEGAVFS